MYYTPGHFLKKSDTGDVLHDYSPFDGNYMIVKIYGTKVLFHPLKSRNRLPMYDCRLGAGESGSEVRASEAKL